MTNSKPSVEENDESDTRIVTEIPPAMNALVTWIARAFYAPEHCTIWLFILESLFTFADVVLDLIRRCQCIQDEALQKRTYFELKFLRQVRAYEKTTPFHYSSADSRQPARRQTHTRKTSEREDSRRKQFAFNLLLDQLQSDRQCDQVQARSREVRLCLLWRRI